jgi:hypothetical protein
MHARTLGMLAIYAGSTPAILLILHFAMGDAMWASGVPVVFAFGTYFAFPAAALGIVWRFHDRLGPLGAFGAILVTLGTALILLAPTASVALPIGSAMLMLDLARTGVARRPAIAQLAALSLGVGLALLNAAHTSTPPIASGVALYGYLLSWVAIGVWLIRGVPQPQGTSA